MGNISNNDSVVFKDGSWYHRYKVICEDGTIRYRKATGFKTKEEASLDHSVRVDEYENQVRQMYAGKDMHFTDYMKYWFENIYSTRIESTTKALGAYVIYDLIIPCVRYELTLKQITSAYLDEILECSSKSGKSAGETCRSLLYRAFNDAVVHGYITYNPVRDTKLYRRPKPQFIILNKQGVIQLLEQSKNSNWYLEVLLGLFCGLRKGEMLGLKCSDYDANNKTITINRQLVQDIEYENGKQKVKSRQLIERSPKTENSIRTIKLPDIVADELNERLKTVSNNKQKFENKYQNHDYISCQENGEPHSLSAMNIALTKICTRASIPHITVHGLRHMCASILLEQGTTLPKISSLLGHTSIHTTFEYYCQSMDEKEKIISYMNEIFGEED